MTEMLGISTIMADEAGAINLSVTLSPTLRTGMRRVTRTKTLDGGCVIYDGGFSDSDRTWSIEADITKDNWDDLWAIHKSYSLVNLAVKEGFFSGCIETAVMDAGKVTLSILIKEKLT
jgi:hypothetical protein